ncbi:glycosyltransferase [uncultured Selenomonas sp.]|uniref:glycosyltransferase n=1 Tax=uncultured Selenomonas sp. TaxID=159275 RepID=UPI0028E73583|nr:glycosyltransferase [uncultured Selenomonas sp.]
MLSTKISIITVVYNAAATIEQTILSVVKQDYSNIEYIIVDGGSTDGTLDIVKKYEEKIALWLSEPDHGIYDAMNKGLTHATGDYIYYLGADDCLLAPTSISQVVSFLQDNPEVDVLCASVMMVDTVYRIEKVYSSNFSEADVLSGYNTPHQGMFVRREILQKYRFDTSYHIAADYKNFLKFYLDQNIALKQTAMIVAYYANDGVSGNGTDAQRMEDVRALQENGVNVTAYYAKKKQEKSSHMTNILRWVFDKTGILRQIRLRRGWKKHRCGWEVCRWCNR